MKKKIANRLEWVFLILFLIGFVALLSSCRAKETTIKTITDTKINLSENNTTSIDTQTNTQRQETSNEADSKKTEINQSEDLSITHKTIKYDTDKPIDPTTGKHPIKEETLTIINKQTKEESKQSQQSTKDISNVETIQNRVKQLTKINTQSALHYVVKNETKNKNGLSTIHQGLIVLGLLFLGVLGFVVYRWIKK